MVRNDVLEADGALIRIGVAMGEPAWGCRPSEAKIDDLVLFGATVTGNVLRGGPYHYGFVVDAVRDWTVLDECSEGAHEGAPSLDLRGRVASPPAPFLIHRAHSSATFQEESGDGHVELALWAAPTP